MSQITGTKLAILNALSSGEFVSGQQLGEQLNISHGGCKTYQIP